MSATQTQIGNAVLTSLVEMKQKSDSMKIEDVGAMFENIASSLHLDSADSSVLRDELNKISTYITEAKQEIGSMRVEGDESKDISQAGIELDAVVKDTEEATNKILDAADEIGEHVTGLSDAKAVEAINDSVAKIYNACNFQDITGQRIRKVVSIMEYVEHKVTKLTALIDGTGVELSEEDEAKFKDARPDAELCNGPQASGDAPSQDDIDALFDSI